MVIFVKDLLCIIDMIMSGVFLILFMCPSTLIYLCMLNHICIPRMRPSWSWCMSFSMCVKFRLWVFWWEFLHLCSSTQSSSKFQHHFHRNRKKINPKTHFGNTEDPDYPMQSWAKKKRSMLEVSHTIPDFKLYYRAILTKTAWYWYKYRHINPSNRTEDSLKSPYNYINMIFSKCALNLGLRKDSLFNKFVFGFIFD
jgi:hypothetical protein